MMLLILSGSVITLRFALPLTVEFSQVLLMVVDEEEEAHHYKRPTILWSQIAS